MSQIVLPYFNLLDEEWVPVIMGDGRRRRFCLLELFRQADVVRAVEHPSPLVTAALHRVLLAILYRSLSPKADSDELAEWFVDGWPLEQITEYLEKYRERFYLFHETYPFWQVADLDVDEKERKSWSVLAAEHNASSSEGAKILFDHPCQENPFDENTANVTCWLVATQIFALPGGRGYSPAPSSSALFVFSIGNNLRETLLFNFPPQKRDVAGNDVPVWEGEAETMASIASRSRRFPSGYANAYTWRSRAVRLYRGKGGTVSQIGFKPGIGLEKENVTGFFDPMISYKDSGLPVQPSQRGLWREFDSLLPYRGSANSGKSCAPLVIENTVTLCQDLEPSPQKLSVMICGQVNDNAKIEFWRMERFTLPAAILDESNDVRGTIRKLLDMAEEWQSRLYKACSVFAIECIRRNAEQKPAAPDIKKVVEQMPCTGVYWNHLERSFRRNLENGFTEWKQAETLWRDEIRDALDLAWKAQLDSVGDGDAWTIRAMTKAGGGIGKAIKDLQNATLDTDGKVG